MNRVALDLVGQRNNAEAVKKMLEMLSLVPEHALVLSFVGQLYANNNRPEDAERALRRLLVLEPNNVTVLTWLASALAEQGRGSEAMAQYRKALRVEPDNDDVRRGLSRLLATHPDSAADDAREALELAEAAQQQSAEDPLTLRALAAAYAANGRFAEAIRAAEKAILNARAAKNDMLGKQTRGELVLYRQQRRFMDPTLIN